MEVSDILLYPYLFFISRFQNSKLQNSSGVSPAREPGVRVIGQQLASYWEQRVITLCGFV